MFEKGAFALGTVQTGLMGLIGLTRSRKRLPRNPDTFDLVPELAIGIQRGAVERYVHQRAVIVLTMNFRQQATKLAQQVYTRRLVVDEHAGFAIGTLDAADDNAVPVSINLGLRQQRIGRMTCRWMERRCHAALVATGAHQRGITARPQRQTHGIEQNGLAGPGLAGQHAKTFLKIEVQLFDQDNVAYGKMGKHDVLYIPPFGESGEMLLRITVFCTQPQSE